MGAIQYNDINFIDNNTLQASKIVNNSIGQTQLNTTFYDKSIYCYENWRDIFTGNISLAALNSPASNGIYYLRASKSGPLLTQISWELTSSLTPSITLPYTILSSNSSYGSADTCAFKIIQQTNRTTSTGAGFTVAHADNINLYFSQFGYNSSGRFPTVSPNYIQFQSPYAYIYSQDDIFLFCKSTTNNNISVRIQCMSNPDKVYISSNTNLNNWNLENTQSLYITNIYPNTTNNAAVRVFSNLESSGIFKCDTLQAYSATNIIKFNNNTNHQLNNITNVNLLYLNELFPAVTFIKCNANLEITNILKTDFIQGYSVANLIKFNNNCDFQNNNIINYNLGYQTMLKTTSGLINLKTATNNTFVGWGCVANDDLGIGMGLYRDNSGVSSVYHSFNKNYSFGTPSVTLYSINYIAGFSRHTLLSTNMDIDMDTNSTIYTNFLRAGNSGTLDIFNMRARTNINMNGYTFTNWSAPAANLTGSDSIPVNTGNLNFLTKSASTVNGITMYGLDSNSFIIQNNSGENCGAGFCGSQDNISLWSATDNNNFISFVDEDVGSSRFGGINGSAQIFTGSSRLRKHSIKDKNNNNVLDRFLKIKIKSYGIKYQYDDNYDDKKKTRIINKMKKQNIGIIMEELYNLFPNSLSFYNNSLDDNLIDNEDVKNKDITFNNKPKLEDIDIINEGIIYEKLFLYNIMAFQEYVKKTDETINNLQKKYDDLENKFNILMNNLNINNLIYNGY